MAQGNPENITFEMITEAAKKGDTLAISVLDESINQIGSVISMAINFLNPAMIIFDKKLSLNQDFLDQIKRVIFKKSFRFNVQNIKLVTSQLGDYAASMGAASLWIDKIFQIEPLAHKEIRRNCLC